MEIAKENGVDLIGASSSVSKNKKSTASPALKIQSVDFGNLALLASNDLSAEFDLVNFDLLIKHLIIISLPHDIIILLNI